MKRTCCTVTLLTVLGLASALGQQPPAPAAPSQAPLPPAPRVALPQPPTPAPAPPDFNTRLKEIIERTSGKTAPEPALTKFNLDFPGGTPKELVDAIQKAMERPLNAIIPDDLADTKLPAVKMNSVDVAELFSALRLASVKLESYWLPGYNNYQTHQTVWGFKTEGKPSDDSIWYFYAEKPIIPPGAPEKKVSRFYSLAPYLERGTTVDDITTAVETAWKMLGETSPPTISFHKDTKLLIAVGDPTKLETIDAVLKALEPPKSAPGPVMRLLAPGSIPTPPQKSEK
jgi:hypothetical protein